MSKKLIWPIGSEGGWATKTLKRERVYFHKQVYFNVKLPYSDIPSLSGLYQ